MTIKIPEWYCDPPCNRVYYGGPLEHCPHIRTEAPEENLLKLVSFGYLHLPTDAKGRPIPPAADRVEDVRDRLRDPARAREILDLDGLHPRVQDVVLNTAGARELIDNLVDYALLPSGPTTIAVGCAGGRHRACGLVELTAQRLRALGRGVEIEHLHAHLPRILKQATCERCGQHPPARTTPSPATVEDRFCLECITRCRSGHEVGALAGCLLCGYNEGRCSQCHRWVPQGYSGIELRFCAVCIKRCQEPTGAGHSCAVCTTVLPHVRGVSPGR
ncbi:RNase adapter RapZ [Nonomuraea sp. NPDC023979]|uniref:RapZ C-terminal domain-containing protein n=1 Tax=Nonomuraea sp. NPDC023979 TaxID=3154796 RepID=UPI0033CE20EE